MFDAADAFRLLNVVAGIRGADQKQAVFEGGYETSNGSTLQVEYRGTPADAQPLRDFLDHSFGPPRTRRCGPASRSRSLMDWRWRATLLRN
jgi:hypothetical protein